MAQRGDLPDLRAQHRRRQRRRLSDPGSILELYRAALRLRRELPALGDGSLRWLDSADGVLAFAREPGFTCLVNCPATSVTVPLPGTLVLASVSQEITGTAVTLPADSASWWRG